MPLFQQCEIIMFDFEIKIWKQVWYVNEWGKFDID